MKRQAATPLIIKFIVGVLLTMAHVTGVDAQSLTVFNVNADQFPVITADYIAYDASGNILTGLRADQFQIIESTQSGNTANLSATISNDCSTTKTQTEVSIMIILDRSQSMRDDVNGTIRFKYAQQALAAFVNKIRFTGETRVMLTTFSGDFEVSTPWTNNPRVILDTLNKMEPQSSTDYRKPFEDPGNNIYELFKQRPSSLPRYVFFLTDGHPNPVIEDENKFITQNIPTLRSSGIRFYSVTLMERNTHATIAAFASATGGKSIVAKETELIDLFSYLALETQSTETCTLSWVSPVVCKAEDRNRTAAITLKTYGSPTAAATYTTPPESVGGTLINFPVLFCGNPDTGRTSQADVVVQATGVPLTVTGYTIDPDTYFSVADWGRGTGSIFTPFTLKPGEKTSIRVRFTQGSQQVFRQARLSLLGTPCPPNIELVGGQGFVILNHPIGGEVFSACDTITISWSGVLPTTPVRLEYSSNSGSSWEMITNDATSLTYRWLPPQPGKTYRIRVSVAPLYEWVYQYGGTGSEVASSIAVSPDDNAVYVTGWFEGQAKFGTTTLNSTPNNIDGFLCRLDTFGMVRKLMHLMGISVSNDRITGCVTDADGNVYVTGFYTNPRAEFNRDPIFYSSEFKSNMFIYKLDRNLNIVWKRAGSGYNETLASPDTVNANTTGIGIRYNSVGKPEILVTGTFSRYLRVGTKDNGLPAASNPYYLEPNDIRNYYAIYDERGFATFNEGLPPDGFVMQALEATDSKGNIYQAGTFYNTKRFSPPPKNLTASGKTDVFASKYASIHANSARSDSDFTIQMPELSYRTDTVIMDPTPHGASSAKSFSSILCNTGIYTVEIVTTRIRGTDSAQFVLQSQLENIRLQPGECVSVELIYTPGGIRHEEAFLEVMGSCNTYATLFVSANGIAPCKWESVPTVLLGGIAAGISARTFSVANVLCNNGPVPLSGTVTASGSDNMSITKGGGPFVLKPSQCLSLEVTVNPLTIGQQTLTVQYGLPPECETPVTTLSVDVVEPRLSITNVDFGRHRVGNVIYDSIFIRNLATQPALITAITPESPASPNIAYIIDGVSLPLELQPGEQRSIAVRFSPQERGLHTTVLNVTVTGQTAPLTSNATGYGFLPAISATGYNFPAVTVGNTARPNGFVVITNADTSSPLTLFAIHLEGLVPDFTAINWPTFPLTLPPGDKLHLEVSFTAQAPGGRRDTVIIEHDAKPGPEPITPYAQTAVAVTGVGFDKSSLAPIDFQSVFSCRDSSQSLTITNPHPTDTLYCLMPVLSGDVHAFSVSPGGAFWLAPGMSETITVRFSPPDDGVYALSCRYNNNQNLDLVVNALGRGFSTSATVTPGDGSTIVVGAPFTVPVYSSIGSMHGVPVTAVDITVSYPAEFLGFRSVGETQNGWTFDVTNVIPGSVTLHGTPTGTTLENGLLLNIIFDPYITAQREHEIRVLADVTPRCVHTQGGVHQYRVDAICFPDGRIITVAGSRFSFSNPQPNPVHRGTIVRYSTGITCSSRFVITDNIGNQVFEVQTPILPPGDHELPLDVSHLANGHYFLRMESGPYNAVRPLLIVR